MSAELPAFDVRGPLPHGITVLEASAGTGKTYAVTGLAARYVAEGTPLERILLVTFTRMATGELRERVRERLLGVEQALRRDPPPSGDGDPVVALLRERGAAAVAVAGARLARALSDFDAGTIATTHGFCQEALGGLGIAADLEPDVSFSEDLSDLVEEVLDDLYLRAFYRQGDPAFTLGQAQTIARASIGHPDAVLAPAGTGVTHRRWRLAVAVREELERRKRRLSVMTYDDLLARLRDALHGPDGAAVAARLRERYEVVLVDEFQDTDPVQWEIMRRAFGSTARALVLIADPKQAIYAFRGADVYAYLRASGEARSCYTLRVNRRSDQPLLDAFDALFANARLGHEGIVYRQVCAAGAGAPPLHGAPLRLRIAPRDVIHGRSVRQAAAAQAREFIADDVAGDIVGLLESGAQVAVRAPGAPPGACEAVCPGHVAVLVRTNSQAALVEQALTAIGVPAVINGAGSVFLTDAAQQWLALLEALERPASLARAHRVALTPFVGWPAAAVAGAGDAEWERVHERLHEWARLLREHGVALLLETMTREEHLGPRVLACREGERLLTDVRHVGQLLHAAAAAEHLGATALGGWLRRRIVEAGRDSADEDRTRRLESDAQAVQVLTIHRSKGLEFPIVYLPYLWDNAWIPDTPEPVAFHDPERDDRRTLDVALEGPDYREHRQRAIAEQRGEDLRLAYVGLTRARHQAVVWWAGTRDSGGSPLSRLVFDRQGDGTVPAHGSSTRTDAAARSALETVAARAPGSISVEIAGPPAPGRWTPVAARERALEAARFERSLDRRWRRTSYTDMTAGTHEAAVGSEPEEPTLPDEPDAPDGATSLEEPAMAAATATASLLRDLPIGVAAGTLVHQALEAADFRARDLAGELTRALEGAPGRRAVAIASLPTVVAGLSAALTTPLGSLAGGLRLADVARGDRVDELGFELPLAGGERPRDGEAVTPGRLARVLEQRLGPDDPMFSYAARLHDPALRQSVRGYLSGSLDLVTRIDGGRFLVADYKTNWLAPPDAPLSTWHYRPDALVEEMNARHYGLQALLYLVALHRYLRWRLPGYDPDRHIAGVVYLFLRGMAGPQTPVVGGEPYGVFAWAPPPGLVGALSDVLDGREAA